LNESLRVSRLHWPVTTLGPGRRLGLWLQGCSIGCKGCVSLDTWAPDQGTLLPVKAVIELLDRLLVTEALSGITITGGEPFDQPEPLLNLLEQIVYWRNSRSLYFDIFCYSGYPFKRLHRKHGDALALVDLLCAGPFVESRGAGGPWQGSANQSLFAMGERGEAMLSQLSKQAAVPRLQLAVRGGRIWIVGIPAPGDMEKLNERSRESGLNLVEASWIA